MDDMLRVPPIQILPIDCPELPQTCLRQLPQYLILNLTHMFGQYVCIQPHDTHASSCMHFRSKYEYFGADIAKIIDFK